MKKYSLYTIRHISLREMLQRNLMGIEKEKGYLAYWWDEIPLGHCWVKNLGEAGTSSSGIWNTISPAVSHYCSLSGKVELSKMAELWSEKNYPLCLRLFSSLFDEYASPGKEGSSDLSLVICTRNRPLHLKACLDSLGDLSVQPMEIIVVDNAPDDASTKRLVEAYPKVKYVLEAKQGLDRARNTGWHRASASIVAYTDDDVRLHKDWVWQTERAFNDLRVKAVTGIVFADELNTKAQVIFERYWSFNRGYRDIYYDTDYFRERLKSGVPAWDVGAGANMAFRRSVLEAVGDFDNRLDVGASGCNGDSEMWYRIMAAGWTIHYTPRAIAHHTHRREMRPLKRQIYYYLRGATSSLLVQYQRNKHRGNLHYLFKILPEHYMKSLIRKVRYPKSGKYSTIFQEITGSLSGVGYFLTHRRVPVESHVNDSNVIQDENPSVSVIITAYNHGHYIGEAIESVLCQTHRPFEVVVVDDGSTDNTEQIVSLYPEVVYIHQRNKGLAAARNTGVFNSRGNYIVFLDADDLLYPPAIAKNLDYFRQFPSCMFISGWHDKVDEEKKLIETYESEMPVNDHYMALLQGNFIGMHAAVMYRREVFNIFLYDETLPACEDYDLYLRIAKRYPIFSHNEKLAAYRIHSGNMSADVHLMLKQAKAVLSKNADLCDKEVRKHYQRGVKVWTDYYARETYRRIAYRYLYPGYRFSIKDLFFVAANMPVSATRLVVHKIVNMFGKSKTTKKIGSINLGDLRRTTPVSKDFGYDRGGPVDRYYIENFLQENAEYIRGDVLEIGDNAYTITYGAEKVSKSDILYIDDSIPEATIIGDLSTADHIASDRFDCIILTQTLHFIYDFRGAVAHCYRILKPGGVLLLTVPGITKDDYDAWGDTWYWSFTGRAIQRLLSEYFDSGNLLVQTHGNVLAASTFLYGLGRNEITNQEKDEHDPHFQVIITARAIKK